MQYAHDASDWNIGGFLQNADIVTRKRMRAEIVNYLAGDACISNKPTVVLDII